MVVTSAIVGVKRMALHEVEMLSHEVKSVLRPNEDGRAVFKVMPPERLGEGVLFRCGKWKESGGRSVGGIHTLCVRGVATDIPTIAGMIKTEKVTFAMDMDAGGSGIARAGSGRISRAPSASSASEGMSESLTITGRKRYGLPTTTTESVASLVVEDVVLKEGDIRELGGAIAARDGPDYDGCHCTLKSLHFGNNVLGPAGCVSMSKYLERNLYITRINLIANGIRDVGAKSLISACTERTCLTSLSLAENLITDKGVEEIHYLIEMCDSLQELHLNSNVIGDGGATKLAHGLVLSTSLHILNLNGNRVRDEGMGQLCMALDLNSSSLLLKQTFGSTPRQWNGTSGPSHPNKSLTSLHLASNWLRDGALIHLAPVLTHNTRLTSIELANNRIGDAGADALGSALSANNVPGKGIGRKLVLSCNTITVAGLKSLEDALRESGPVHRLAVEGVRGGNLERRAAVERECKPRVENAAAIQSGRLETVVPKPPRKPPKTGRAPTRRGTMAGGNVAAQPGAASSRSGGGTKPKFASSPGTTEHLVAGLGLLSHIKHLDTDPDFVELCQRMNVPVSDRQRAKLEKIDALQRQTRSRIYDQLLSMEEKHPRPILNAAKRVQSLYRMVKGKVDVEEKKYRFYLAAQKKASSHVSDEMSLTRQDVVQRLAQAMSLPTANRFWNFWRVYMMRARVMVEDTTRLYPLICAGMGSTPCGLKALAKHTQDFFSDRLDMSGLGMTQRGARALCLALSGIEPCNLCKGHGWCDPAVFDAFADSSVLRKSAKDVFAEVDQDKNGSVDFDELRSIVQRLGFSISKDDMLTVWSNIGKQKHESITLPEFEGMFGREQGGIGCFMCHGLGHINERAKVVEDASPFLREIQSLPSIREFNGADQLASLVLSSNSVKPAGCTDLIWLIQSHFQSLRTLSLSQCELGCAGAKSIAKLLTLKNIPILELDVSNNGLGDEGTAVVCDAAADSETLAVLNISKNGIGRGGTAGLSRLLSNSGSLRSLDVSWNNIRGDAAHLLCDGISQSMTLINLNLAWNGLGEASGCNALHDALKWSNMLKIIDLSENRVAYTGACILAKGLAESNGLDEMDLNGNPVTVAGAKALMRAANPDKGESDPLRKVLLDHVFAGIADMTEFDPLDPEGEYILDMELETGRRVMRNVLKLIAQDKAYIVQPPGITMVTEVPVEVAPPPSPTGGDKEVTPPAVETVRTKDFKLPCFSTRNEFEAWYKDKGCMDVMDWQLPESGTLIFSFKSSAGNDTTKGSELHLGAHNKTAHELPGKLLEDLIILIEGQDPETNADKPKAVARRLQTGDYFLTFQQASKLFSAASATDDLTAAICIACTNRILDCASVDDMLNLLATEARPAAILAMIQSVRFEFSPENPTGHYDLDLSNKEERDLAAQLIDMARAQSMLEMRLGNYYKGRYGGPREVKDRCWRNSTLDGRRFSPDGLKALPNHGLLSVDFVKLVRHGKTLEQMQELTLDETGFKALAKEIKDSAASGAATFEMVAMIRHASTKYLFTCQQATELLEIEAFYIAPRAHFQPRVEILVALFGRTADWRGFAHVIGHLTPLEQHAFYRRVGRENAFDETMAVQYYELDLADASCHFVAQELVHLSLTEPGQSMRGIRVDGCDFEIPKSWSSFIPKRGTLSLYFVRDAAVLFRVSDGRGYSSRLASPGFSQSSASAYIPAWLREPDTRAAYSYKTAARVLKEKAARAKRSKNVKPCILVGTTSLNLEPYFCSPFCQAGSIQPAGDKWLRAHRMHYLKARLQETSLTSRDAFDYIDLDSSHTISHRELTYGLFRLHVWLDKEDRTYLWDRMDADAGSLQNGIDHHEWEEFWANFKG